MIDKEKLKKAQEWADQASEIAKYSPTIPERAKAAAEVIKSLPDTVVDGKDLREVIERWSTEPLTSETAPYMAEQLRELLPDPPAPRTMAEVEWSDEEHRFAGAETENGHELVMLELRRVDHSPHISLILCVDPDGNVDTWLPRHIAPTGRKYRLEPEDDTPTSPIEDKPAPEAVAEMVRLRRALEGWRGNLEHHLKWTLRSDVREIEHLESKIGSITRILEGGTDG